AAESIPTNALRSDGRTQSRQATSVGDRAKSRRSDLYSICGLGVVSFAPLSTATQISPPTVTENSPPPGSLCGLGGADYAGLELIVEAAFGEGAGQGGNEDGGRGEEHAVAALDGLEAEPDGEMGLAHAGRAEDHQVLTVLEEVTHAERLDLLAVDGGLIAEVE